MVHDDGLVGLDAMRVSFDDERVVSDAGIVLVATLAGRLGIEALAQRFVRLRPDQRGRVQRRAQGHGVDLRDGARGGLHR